MKRIIKYNVISEKSTQIRLKITELEKLKEKLKLDITLVSNSYKGKDADDIIGKYISNLKYLEKYISVISRFQAYFDWLSGNYKDTNQKAVKDFTPVTKGMIDIDLNNTDMFLIDEMIDGGGDISA